MEFVSQLYSCVRTRICIFGKSYYNYQQVLSDVFFAQPPASSVNSCGATSHVLHYPRLTSELLQDSFRITNRVRTPVFQTQLCDDAIVDYHGVAPGSDAETLVIGKHRGGVL